MLNVYSWLQEKCDWQVEVYGYRTHNGVAPGYAKKEEKEANGELKRKRQKKRRRKRGKIVAVGNVGIVRRIEVMLNKNDSYSPSY